MNISTFLLLWTYLGLAFFAVAAGIRVLKYFKMPKHLRWELYPVKHEAGKKADYGGSYLEEPEWWTKEKETSLYNELKYMIPEILFIRGLWEENRPLWYVSFPFHFGLYLLIGAFGLMVLSAVGMLFGLQVMPGGGFFGAALYYLTTIMGYAGLTLGTFGSAGLLFRRLTDEELKPYTTFSDIFNLLAFFVFFVIALLAWLTTDLAFDGARAFVYSLITFGQGAAVATQPSLLGALTVIIAVFLAAYIPLTHMSHMFMKYFMYHEVKWEDEPNLKGSKLEAQIMANLGYKPTWAASHINADGEKTWADIATSMPDFGDEK